MHSRIEEVRRTLGVLFEPGDTIELRCVGDRTINGYYRDQQKLATDAVRLNQDFSPPQNVYLCLNPVQPELYARRADDFGYASRGSGTKDSEISCRRWLLVDVDPVRPVGVSSTNAQKQAAIEQAKQVYSWLQEQVGSSSIVCGDSGNGAHLLLRLADLPADEQTDWHCKQLIGLLDARFSNAEAKVDGTSSNPARIGPLYGTIKRKGSSTAEQPHRWSQLVYVPETIRPLTIEQLQSITGPFQAARHATQQSNDGFNIEQQLTQRGIEYTVEQGTSASGEQWKTYHIDCQFSREHSDGFVIGQWDNGAIFAKCHHDTCQGKGWADVKQIWQLHNGEELEQQVLASLVQQPPAPHELLIVRSQDIQPEQISWLWQDRFVVGGINLCCGRGGIGKTFFLCDLVARITNPSLLSPNGQPLRHGRVLYSTGEDHIAKILEPRMQAHGADRSRLEYVKGLPVGKYVELLDVLRHADVLREAIRQRPDTVAIVLDPISSFQGGADSNKVSQVRQFTAVLTQISEEFDIAIIGIHHFSKAKRDVAGDAISGSHAYRDAARAIWLFALDAKEPTRRLMVCDKHNWSEQRPLGLAYRIEQGRIAYETEALDLSADELMSQGTQVTLEIACSWLLAQLSSGPQPAINVLAAAALERISERTINRAKKQLGVVAKREGNHWTWTLPTVAQE